MPEKRRYTTCAEDSAAIRKTLKDRHGWTGADVSVRSSNYSMGSSINIKVKNPTVDFKVVEEIANEKQKIDRCEMTGDILSGGNRFVFVGYTSEAEEAIGAPYLEQIAAIHKDPESQSTGWAVHDVGRCQVGLERDSEQDHNRYFHIHPPQDDESRPHSVTTYTNAGAAYYVGYFSDVEGKTPAEPPQGEELAESQVSLEQAAPGVGLRRNDAKGGFELIFSEKPDDSTREMLKAAKWRWSRRQGLWYTRQSNPHAASSAAAILAIYGEEGDAEATIAAAERDYFDMAVEDDMARRAGVN